MSFLVSRTGRLHLFEKATQLENFSGMKILDYGGNIGNLLLDGIENKTIEPENYTCIDVDLPALKEGENRNPTAQWVHYDRYNQVYNTKGIKKLPLPFEDNTFDIACAHSVHSHCSYEDFLFDISELRRVAKIVVTSYIDTTFLGILKMKRKRDFGKIHPAWDNPLPLESYRYYVDAEQIEYDEESIPDGCNFLITCYNNEWLKETHPEFELSPANSIFNQPMIVIR